MFLPKMFQIPQMFGQNRGKIYRFINIITFEQRLHNLGIFPLCSQSLILARKRTFSRKKSEKKCVFVPFLFLYLHRNFSTIVNSCFSVRLAIPILSMRENSFLFLLITTSFPCHQSLHTNESCPCRLALYVHRSLDDH